MNRSSFYSRERRAPLHQHGSAALAALVCLIVVLVIVLGLMNLATVSLTVGKRARTEAQLRALTDGGLEYGYNTYAWGAWSTGAGNWGSILPEAATNISLGPGTFSVTVTDNSASIANTIKVVCTGTIGSASLTETRIFPQPWYDPPNYSNFYGNNQLMINGNGTLANGRLRITDGGENETTTAFLCSPLPVSAFHVQFTFQIVDDILWSMSVGNVGADGFTFCIQNDAPWIMGGVGTGGLGYGPTHTGGAPGIPNSVAIKFDLWNNDGEGYNSTGCYTNGAAPTIPATDLTSSGVNLHSGDIMQANLVYNGSTLTVTIKDTATGKSATQSYTVNIHDVINSSVGYFGFTGATGSATATQDILTLTYTSP